MKTSTRSQSIRAIHDTMDVLSGKWKITIITSLSFGQKRYSEILKDVTGISGKVLSRELKEMEMNWLIHRHVMDTQPVTVQYNLTEYSKKLMPIICSLSEWGTDHRLKITGKQPSPIPAKS